MRINNPTGATKFSATWLRPALKDDRHWAGCCVLMLKPIARLEGFGCDLSVAILLMAAFGRVLMCADADKFWSKF
jgi:hypothetical protein